MDYMKNTVSPIPLPWRHQQIKNQIQPEKNIVTLNSDF